MTRQIATRAGPVTLRQKLREATRLAIFEAAEEVLVTRGFAAELEDGVLARFDVRAENALLVRAGVGDITRADELGLLEHAADARIALGVGPGDGIRVVGTGVVHDDVCAQPG